MNTAGPGKSAAWWVVVGLGWLVATYALAMALLGERMYPPDLKASFLERPWGITTHAFFGAVAMLLGPWQFRRGPRWNRGLHRWLGRGYLVACGLSGGAGLYLAPYSYGGIVTHLGFGLLAVSLLVTSGAAYFAIQRRRVAAHREWMVRSYALIFAAVTLRLELPTLAVLFGAFLPAYLLVAWLCWVPNLVAAEWYLARSRAGIGASLPAI